MIGNLNGRLSLIMAYCFMSILLTMSFHASANKVKIKRDFIYIDKKKTPLRVEKDGSNTYVFTDSSSGEVFVTASYYFERIDEENDYQWLVMKRDGSPFENEVDLEYLSFTLSVKKAVAEFMMKKLGFFDAKGVLNQSKLDEFFAQKRERKSLVAQASAEKEAAITAERIAEQEALFEQTARLGLRINQEPREIFRKIDSENLPNGKIGTYRFADQDTIVLRDLDKIKIATITQDVLKRVTVSSSFLAEPLSYESRDRFKRGAPDDTRAVILEAVRHLHARNVRFGYEAKGIAAQYNADIKAEQRIRYEEAKVNSSNIYERSGYAIDHKGERYEGKITALFEKLSVVDPDDITSGGSILDLTSSGSKFRIEYLNAKQKTKFKKLSTARKNRFCVFEQGGEESCYRTAQIKSNGLLAAAGNDALDITPGQGNKFLREVFERGDIAVYQEPTTKAFYIKSSKQKKTFSFKFGPLVKEARKAEKLKKYLGGCDYADDAYDENALRFDLNEVQELVEYYNENCG